MDNRINDKDLEFVTGGSAATPELERALESLRMAKNLFTDDMPEAGMYYISEVIRAIEDGLPLTGDFREMIQLAKGEFSAFYETLYDDLDKKRIVHHILSRLDNALAYLN